MSVESDPAGDDPSGRSAPDENDHVEKDAPAASSLARAKANGVFGGAESRNAELEDLRSQLRDRDLQIESLERSRQKQDESIALLRSELGAVQIKHKEECYWLRLEVDNLRKDKEALEDRMAELYRDMREIDNMMEGEEEEMGGVVCVDSGYVLHLQSQLSKSMQTMGVLDNQIGMVKKSCDEVVKSLKEEIADVMDDKCRIEMELLNQLAVLDNEKRSLEDEYDREVRLRDERIKGRDDVIQTLRDKADDLEEQLADAREKARTASGEESREARERVKASVDRAIHSCSAFDASSSVMSSSGFDDTGWKARDAGDTGDGGDGGSVKGGSGAAAAAGADADADAKADDQEEKARKAERDELSKRVEELERENALLEDKLREEQDAIRETSIQLRQNLEEQDERIEQLTEELDAAHASKGAVADAEAILEEVRLDRIEALDMLERVAEVWERADEAIQTLEEIMEDMQSRGHGGGGDEDRDRDRRARADREKVLTTLETATLVHSQIKLSLLLVELKLRNQLTTLRNDGKLPTALEGGVGVAARPAIPSGNGSVAPGPLDETSFAEFKYHVDEVQRETLDSLEEVEKSLEEQVKGLERLCDEEVEDLRAELGENIASLLEMREKNEKLEFDRAELEKKLGALEGEKKELGRKNRELMGRAADADLGTSELKKEMGKLGQENADLAKEKRALEKERKELERANRELEKAKKEYERSAKEMERQVKDVDRGIRELEQNKKELEESVERYKREAKEAKAVAKESAKKAAEAAEKSMNGSGGGLSIDSAQIKMFEKLQKEIGAVVGKIKEKNETISKLTETVEEYKVREVALRREMKRIMKRVRAIEEGNDRGMGDR